MMGWRYRKSKKIAPGTRININGSGVSITNRVGKTGIYHRTQLVGGRKNEKSGCLPLIVFVVLLCVILSALGFGKKDEESAPSAAPIVTAAPTPTVEPTPTPTPEPTVEPTPEEAKSAMEQYEDIRAKLDELAGN